MGIWEHMDDILIPMELRFLTRREPSQKYCADLVNDFLYSPQHYHKVSIENRLFFCPRDVLTAIQQAFRPTHDCPEWLHKAWKVLQAEDGRRGEEDPRRKRREELSERISHCKGYVIFYSPELSHIIEGKQSSRMLLYVKKTSSARESVRSEITSRFTFSPTEAHFFTNTFIKLFS